ncbi:response regulator [uncultured Flavobacterium sp.]|uniref:response regulator n=1 Tax=uncultured Flavobacterium sp. TaxID=165435 RepID=UPI0025DEAACB|nr:response regulator [uncultured Flavobacterium sp.]
MKTEFKWNHVVLADDDCTIFTEALNSLHPGLKLSVENNGAALMNFLHLPPSPEADVIFLDLNMPAMSGMDCLKDIRRNMRLKNSVVIMLTTSNHHADIDSSYERGANFFMTKPVSFSALCSLISKAFASIQHYGVAQPPRDSFVLSA